MVCGIVAVVVILATMLIPAINDAQLTAGDEVTYDNFQDDHNLYMRAIKDGDTLVITSDGVNETTATLNGTRVLPIINAYETIINYHTLIFSDVYAVWTGGATGNPSVAHAGSTGQEGAPTGETKIEYNNGTYTETFTPLNGNVVTRSWSGGTWGFICCNADEAEYFESTRTGNNAFYIKNANDVVCSGVYTTGELDTWYWYYNGQSGCNTGYTASTEIGMTLTEGTTDIYDGTVTVSISDGENTEEFVPFRIMIPLEVTGHATSGAMYSLYGVIPIIFVVALVVGAIGIFAIGRRD